MAEITCYFDITSRDKDLDMHLFSSLLEMEPAKVVRIGDPIVSANGVVNHRKTSIWSIQLFDDKERSIESILEKMVDLIYPRKGTLKNALQQYPIDAAISTTTYLTDEPSPSCTLSPELITKLAELGLPLDMTILQGK